MRPKRDPVPRARDAWRWLGGIALLGVLGGGVAVAAVLLWESVDIRQLAPRLTTGPGPIPIAEPPGPITIDRRGFTAVVFASPRNRDYFPDSSYHGRELDLWRGAVREVGGLVREARDVTALRNVLPDELLLLPEAPCVSSAELAAIRAHVRRGGSVVSNWAVGVRNGDCEWRGWAPLLELTEAEAVQELPVRGASYVTVPAGIGLASGLDPGTRIELRPEPSLALRAPGAQVFWSDWALNPATDPGGLGTDVAAVVTRTETGGRTAWFGMRLGQAATPGDSVRLRRLVQNGVSWAAGVPMAVVAPWPGGARAALLFALDVEDRPRNAMGVAELLGAEGMPGTFFVVTRLVTGDAELADALSGIEVGSQTADHAPIGGLTARDQSVRLRRSRDDIEGWTGSAPTGLRPPEDAFDSITLAAWRGAGGTYVLARNEGRSASPEIHSTEEGVVVVLPRLLKDDYNLVVQDRVLRAGLLAEGYLEGTRKMYAIGGLAVVAGHTQILQTPARIDAFRVVGDSVRAQGDWWIARADAVAGWWRARAAARLGFSPPSEMLLPPGTIRSDVSDLLVHAGPGEPLRGAWIDVVLPRGADGLIPLVDGLSVAFETTDWGMRIPIGTLEADSEVRIALVRVAGSATGTQARPQ
jgi:peptidoglycan/xylan/chitin deacetylase (PgdA/CDA1 family)